MKTTEQRINNVIGQLNGIKKMMRSKSDCLLVLNQLKASKSAISSVIEAVTETKLNDCFKKVDNNKKILAKKLFAEIIKK